MLVWALVAVGLFVYCMLDEQLDDFAGWIPAVVVFQIPGFLVAPRPASQPSAPAQLGGSAALFSLSAGFVAGFCAFFAVTIISFWFLRDEFFDFRPLLFGFCAGAITVALAAIRASNLLRSLPHPAGLRRVFLELLLVDVLVILVSLVEVLRNDFSMSLPDKAFLLVLPLLWMAPLWLLLPRRAPTAPRAVAL